MRHKLVMLGQPFNSNHLENLQQHSSHPGTVQSDNNV